MVKTRIYLCLALLTLIEAVTITAPLYAVQLQIHHSANLMGEYKPCG